MPSRMEIEEGSDNERDGLNSTANAADKAQEEGADENQTINEEYKIWSVAIPVHMHAFFGENCRFNVVSSRLTR